MLQHSQLAHADIYKWVDEKETPNFSNYCGTIEFSIKPETPASKKSDKAERDRTSVDRPSQGNSGIMLAQKNYLIINGKRYELAPGPSYYDTHPEERGCEIVSYSQYDIVSDVSGDDKGRIWSSKNTCVDLVIQNNDREAKIITEKNFIAITSRAVVTKWDNHSYGSSTPAETKSKFNPKAVFIQIPPGETYRGSICFDRQLPITKLELQGL